MRAAELVTNAQLAFAFGGVSLISNGSISASVPTGVYYQDFSQLFAGGADAVSGYLSKGTAVGALSTNSAPLSFFTGPNAAATAGSWDVVTPGVSAPFSSGFLVLDFLVSGSNFATILGDPDHGGSIGITQTNNYSRLYVCME